MYALKQFRDGIPADIAAARSGDPAAASLLRAFGESVAGLLALEELSFRLLRKYPGLAALTTDAVAESFYIRGLLERVNATEVDHFEWPGNVRDLSDAVGVHIGRLERSIFPAALRTMDKPDAEELGRLLGPPEVYKTQTYSGA